jgi:hypothetical protein
MNNLTFEEIERIGQWKPYRSDWPFDLEVVEEKYGRFIDTISGSDHFDCKQTQDGGNSNFIEFALTPTIEHGPKKAAILLLISLCAPICVIGEIEFISEAKFFGFNRPALEDLNKINNPKLLMVAKEVSSILKENGILILESEFINQNPPSTLMLPENIIRGEKLFNWLFQLTD